ncbi:hypothetical protein P170DRAFT_480432 [Aspergillus steynii IBT 23096]|uniref:Uncharacterized protein n=1 Tax=Aspergillus steynii IBT 23096 TaxID=1392250 RepID=A0A2I2FS48_9EURO|nr:uncharacterized protein P170DRAFT_480432 [Aspergillus steynii IBT 23096]PLB43460.1 hypothetical protein P170DRAFT_480432 [Aspergillus steynii IBT 23096]
MVHVEPIRKKVDLVPIRKGNLREAGFVLDHPAPEVDHGPSKTGNKVTVVLDIPLHEHENNKSHLTADSSLHRVVQVIAFFSVRLNRNHRPPTGPVPSGYARFYVSMWTELANADKVYPELQEKLKTLAPSIPHDQAPDYPHYFEEQGLHIDGSNN